MCKGMNVLQHGPHGYVAACCGCGRFQVAFGTTLMHLEHEEMQDLTMEVGLDKERFRCSNCPQGKAFVYDTGAVGMRLVLDHREVVQLHGMLTEALWIHGIYASMTDDDR